MQVADRLLKTPPYPFAELARLKREAIAQGVDLIDFGIGDPDQPTPRFMVEAMQRAVEKAEYHQYDETGYGDSRIAARRSPRGIEKRFGVTPGCRNGDSAPHRLQGRHRAYRVGRAQSRAISVLVPDPGYPVYKVGTLFAGAESYFMPLRAERGLTPDLSAIPAEVADRAKIMWLCYPNMPTGGTVDLDFLSRGGGLRPAARYSHLHGYGLFGNLLR